MRLPFPREPGGGGPAGWWIAIEVEVQPANGDLVRPDVLGWRRERCPERPVGAPVHTRPDWICEVVCPSNANDDTIRKLRHYHGAQVPNYWIVDPRDAITIMRWHPDGYVMLIRAQRGEGVRAEPFEAIELSVGTLFGDDPPDPGDER